MTRKPLIVFIAAGMDLESGREGGTWLAMNNGGQIAALLNVLRPTSKVAHGKRNRGTEYEVKHVPTDIHLARLSRAPVFTVHIEWCSFP